MQYVTLHRTCKKNLLKNDQNFDSERLLPSKLDDKDGTIDNFSPSECCRGEKFNLDITYITKKVLGFMKVNFVELNSSDLL